MVDKWQQVGVCSRRNLDGGGRREVIEGIDRTFDFTVPPCQKGAMMSSMNNVGESRAGQAMNPMMMGGMAGMGNMTNMSPAGGMVGMNPMMMNVGNMINMGAGMHMQGTGFPEANAGHRLAGCEQVSFWREQLSNLGANNPPLNHPHNHPNPNHAYRYSPQAFGKGKASKGKRGIQSGYSDGGYGYGQQHLQQCGLGS